MVSHSDLFGIVDLKLNKKLLILNNTLKLDQVKLFYREATSHESISDEEGEIFNRYATYC